MTKWNPGLGRQRTAVSLSRFSQATKWRRCICCRNAVVPTWAPGHA
ncbi:unnamed protein product [Staurois parvus]|uniref:Uncharacterized protein n=1 Tax=Staurois parvus TaxID=386267 RepID=A0ABN9FZR7_9NEOB|nr:unnamed protein product [Staurois parvus]